MTSDSLRLSELSKAVRESTLKRLLLVPGGKENWRPTAQTLSFADLAQHLIDTDEYLFKFLAHPQQTGIKEVPATPKDYEREHFLDLVNQLRLLGERRCELIAGLSGAELDTPVADERFDGLVSLWWVIVRGTFDHEAHHRGQLALYLRMMCL